MGEFNKVIDEQIALNKAVKEQMKIATETVQRLKGIMEAQKRTIDSQEEIIKVLKDKLVIRDEMIENMKRTSSKYIKKMEQHLGEQLAGDLFQQAAIEVDDENE